MKLQILAIGRHPEILATVVRLINSNPQWQATGAHTDDEALQAFKTGSFDIVLLCAGIDPDSEDELRALFKTHNPAIIIVQHYGGGSGLLMSEIYEAMHK